MSNQKSRPLSARVKLTNLLEGLSSDHFEKEEVDVFISDLKLLDLRQELAAFAKKTEAELLAKQKVASQVVIRD